MAPVTACRRRRRTPVRRQLQSVSRRCRGGQRDLRAPRAARGWRRHLHGALRPRLDSPRFSRSVSELSQFRRGGSWHSAHIRENAPCDLRDKSGRPLSHQAGLSVAVARVTVEAVLVLGRLVQASQLRRLMIQVVQSWRGRGARGAVWTMAAEAAAGQLGHASSATHWRGTWSTRQLPHRPRVRPDGISDIVRGRQARCALTCAWQLSHGAACAPLCGS